MTWTQPETAIVVRHQLISICTEATLQIIDLTDQIARCVAESGVADGIANVQSLHTTAALFVNEHEPLLLQDLKDTLERLAPRARPYRHDDFGVRTVNLVPGERPNGHSHCKALFLRTSETLNVVDRRLVLGRWQRVFLVELDGARERTVSVMAMGHCGGGESRDSSQPASR